MARLAERHNHDMDHMPLDEGGTPAVAYVRKMPPRGATVTDEQSGISYRREYGLRPLRCPAVGRLGQP